MNSATVIDSPREIAWAGRARLTRLLQPHTIVKWPSVLPYLIRRRLLGISETPPHDLDAAAARPRASARRSARTLHTGGERTDCAYAGGRRTGPSLSTVAARLP